MKLFENEQTLWESKNKKQLLTTHRLRDMHKSIFGSKIKSIMLEEITFCELRTIRQFRFLQNAVLSFLLINGSVYLLNHYFFKAELIKLFFGEVHIGPDKVQTMFYFSIIVVIAYCAMFFFSIKRFSLSIRQICLLTSNYDGLILKKETTLLVKWRPQKTKGNNNCTDKICCVHWIRNK